MKRFLVGIGTFVVTSTILLGLIFTANAALNRACAAIERSDRETYAAWITYSGRKDITYEQWRMLRNSDLITIRN